MELKEILKRVDHTLLKQTATSADIEALCDEAVKYEVASVCIPQCYVKEAREYLDSLNSSMAVCTVIGFPNGNMTTESKCFEASNAVENGADEIDMVINIGYVKSGRYDLILDEIKKVKEACEGKLLKVIIETCLLTDEEKIQMCKVVNQSGAEYIKTSTGFAGGGATFEDVQLLRKHVNDNVKVKAAGGISHIDDAELFIRFGADRLGTSRIVSMVNEI